VSLYFFEIYSLKFLKCFVLKTHGIENMQTAEMMINCVNISGAAGRSVIAEGILQHTYEDG
jgi:hypothetical protein